MPTVQPPAAEATKPYKTGVEKIGEFYDGHIHRRWTDVIRDYSKPQPYPPKTDSWARNTTTLWVGIASFRDARCGATLFNMFSKAAHPERITAGVVQQNADGDVECLVRYCELMQKARIDPTGLGIAVGGDGTCPYKENIRIFPVEAAEAAGPCWGRHLQYFLLRDEEFCMQTDSHMDYVKDWDVLMMQEWAKAENEYAYLSTYVQGVDDLNKNVNGHYEVSHLCEILFTSQVRNQQAKALRLMKAPKLTSTWGAGYSFSKCHGERAVGYDPHLPQIFDGEEFSKYARLWTRGYDVYTPSRSYIGHDYNHLNAPNAQAWRHISQRHDIAKEEIASDIRLWTLLGMPGGLKDPRAIAEVRDGPWGLGKKRSLQQLYEYVSVNLANKTHIGHPTASCFSKDWVPFEESWPPTEYVVRQGPYLEKARSTLSAQGDWWEPPPPSPAPLVPLLGASSGAGFTSRLVAPPSLSGDATWLAAVGALFLVVSVVCTVTLRSARKKGGAKGMCSLGLAPGDAATKEV